MESTVTTQGQIDDRKSSETLNGLNLTDFNAVIGAVKDDPSLGAFRFRSRNRWIDGTENRTECQDYYGTGRELETRQKAFEFVADEPPVLLGGDKGANPAEYLLTALSSCLTTSLILHATANGIEIGAVRSSAEGDIDLNGFLGLDPTKRRGYEEIRLKFTVKSDEDEAKIRELLATSVILDTVIKPVPVKIEIEME